MADRRVPFAEAFLLSSYFEPCFDDFTEANKPRIRLRTLLGEFPVGTADAQATLDGFLSEGLIQDKNVWGAAEEAQRYLSTPKGQRASENLRRCCGRRHVAIVRQDAAELEDLILGMLMVPVVEARRRHLPDPDSVSWRQLRFFLDTFSESDLSEALGHLSDLHLLAGDYLVYGITNNGERRYTSTVAQRFKLAADRHILDDPSTTCPTTGSIGLVATPSNRLVELSDELKTTRPYPWRNIEKWAERARPLFTRCYPDHAQDFDRLVKAPRPVEAALLSRMTSRALDPYPVDPREEQARLDRALAADALEDEANANTAFEKLAGFLEGLVSVEAFARPLEPPTAMTFHNAQITNITNSHVGAAAIGAGSTATGHVTISPSTPITKEMLKAAVGELQADLLKIQNRLEEIDDRVYDFLSQLLVSVRKLQLEQADMATVQARVKETADEAWAKEAVNEMKPQFGPKVLEGVKLLNEVAKNPLAQELIKGLLEGAG